MKKVIIVGGGLAGMTAAITARKEGADVLLVDRGSVGLGTNSAMANGVFAGPTETYGDEQYVADTIDIGRGINNRGMVEAAARGVREGIELLRSAGLMIAEGAGTYSVKSPCQDIIPGVTLVKMVARALRNLGRVGIVTGFYVTDIVKAEGHVRGIHGFDRTGREATIPADAVVLATGGAGAVYLKNDNQKTIMGQGYRLAAKAGLDLWDMEFVQYYPLVFNDPHLPSMIVFPPYNSAVELRNSAGEDVIAKHNLGNINEAILKRRDEFSAVLFREMLSGPVLMDFRKIEPTMWKEHPLSLLAKMRYDFSAKPVPVSPAAHFFMGGVRTDENAQTDLSGLFACGEVVAGLHGANRRGGNALTECIVFGSIAGRNAARHAFENVGRPAAPPAAKTVEPDGSGDLRTIRREIREIAWNHAGVVRTGSGIEEGLAKIAGLQERLGTAGVHSSDERRMKADLESAAFTVRAILTASLGRHESRGSFLRSDFPNEDNADWKKNSRLSYDAESGSFALCFEKIG